MKMFKKLKDWFELPGPKELGWSEEDALPMKEFGANPGEKTWDDWDEHVKAKFPFRYWLLRTLPLWFHIHIRRPIGDAWYWVLCHTLPSHRYHLLDLRNPGPGIKYTHGWMEPAEKLLWANFILLVQFVEQQKPVDPITYTPEEERQDPYYTTRKEAHDEMMRLYWWWTKGRLEEEQELDDLYRRIVGGTRADLTLWHTAYSAREEREQEMLERLVKIRRYLWT